MAERRRVWVVTDGRPGNEGPAQALARALEAHGWAPAESRPVAPKPWAARLPAALWARIPFRRGGWPFSGYREGAAALEGDGPGGWPDLAISAGRRAAPATAALRRLSGGRVRAVQILDPRMPFDLFDAVVTPAHDGARGAGVIPTLGSLSRVTPALAAEAGAAQAGRFADLPEPRLAAMIGGPSRSARWEADAPARLAAALRGAAAGGWGVMATASRRTPPEALSGLSGPGLRLWDGRGDNPYPGILGLAQAALVTADSVNMISEAASAGLPVLLLPTGRAAPKLARFQAAMVEGGHARWWRGEVARWPPPGLAEAERVAAILADRL